jgi:dipeptidase E
MGGTCYFGCGSADDEIDLWRLMLHRSPTRIVYWPFALPPSMAATAEDWLRESLDRLGVAYQLDTWPDLAGRSSQELDVRKVDLLVVGGGNTFRLLQHVRQAGFVDVVRQFVADGGDYYGGSAGAVLAGEDIAIAQGHDPNEAGIRDLAALGLMSGVSILPHFTEDQTAAARSWADRHDRMVLGLPESTGLRYASGRFEIVGTEQLTCISPGTRSVRRIAPGDLMTEPSQDRGPEFDGVRIGRPATGALVDAGYRRLTDLPAELSELAELHGVGPKAIRLLAAARAERSI